MTEANQPCRELIADSFYKAVVWDNLERVKALLKDNPDLVLTRYLMGETPLHLAAKWGHKEVVALLLANQAEVNAQTESGETPLHYAAENGEKEVAALLLASQAEVNAMDIHGQTPFHLSARWEPEVVELLRQRGGHDAPLTK